MAKKVGSKKTTKKVTKKTVRKASTSTGRAPRDPAVTVEGVLEAWRTNQRINVMILEAVSDEGLRCTLSTRGGRGVSGEFAHLHNNRVYHLEERAKDLASGLVKLDPKADLSREDLIEALEASAAAIEGLLAGVFEGTPKRRGFRKGIFATLAYFVSHEAHHRGRALLTLKVKGETLDRNVAMGIWGWDQIET